MLFYTYPKHLPENLDGYITLHMLGQELSKKDRKFGLFLMDSTWKYEEKMHKAVAASHTLNLRRIPSHFKTAYPRVQTGCVDETRGLATVEALYIALKILGRDTNSILDHYYWKEDFLKINEEAFALLDKSQ